MRGGNGRAVVPPGRGAESFDAVGGVRFYQPRVEFCCTVSDDGAGGRVLGCAYHPAAGFDDRRRLGGDLLDRVAEEILVVEINLGDDGNFWPYDVGCVEASPHADLEYGEVHLAAREEIERHCGEAFEVGGVRCEARGFGPSGEQLLDPRMNPREGGSEVSVGNLLAIETNALVHAFEMWRSVEPGAQAPAGLSG